MKSLYEAIWDCQICPGGRAEDEGKHSSTAETRSGSSTDAPRKSDIVFKQQNGSLQCLIRVMWLMTSTRPASEDGHSARYKPPRTDSASGRRLKRPYISLVQKSLCRRLLLTIGPICDGATSNEGCLAGSDNLVPSRQGAYMDSI